MKSKVKVRIIESGCVHALSSFYVEDAKPIFPEAKNEAIKLIKFTKKRCLEVQRYNSIIKDWVFVGSVQGML